MQSVILNKHDVERLMQALHNTAGHGWPITVSQTESNGIGSCLYVEFDLNVNDVNGRFKITLSDYKDW